jgi:ATP-dependent DNA ligase
LPSGDYLYEPKWDGFRCLAFRDNGAVHLRSRNHRPLARYFPELVEALLALPQSRFVLDGEIMAMNDGSSDFSSLLARLHPAASRVERLRRETPAALVVFDMVAWEEEDLREIAFAGRRRRMVDLLSDVPPPLFLTPLTADRERALRWLEQFNGRGVDGVVAKHRELRYTPGRRRMIKVKPERTADCVVAGFRWFEDQGLPSSLLLGLYDGDELQHVGVAASFSRPQRRSLLVELLPHVTKLAGHPWEGGFLLAGGPLGRLRGAAARWSPEDMEHDWTPLHPELVCEVAYDHVDDGRFRHPARFRRWRPDRDARSCKLHQLMHAPVDLRGLLAPL